MTSLSDIIAQIQQVTVKAVLSQSVNNVDANRINGIQVDNTNLTDNYILVYNESTGSLEYEAQTGSGGVHGDELHSETYLKDGETINCGIFQP